MDEKTWLEKQIELLNWLRNMKTRASTSVSARYYAVAITELEKVIAYFETWVIPGTILEEGGMGKPSYGQPADNEGSAS